MAYSQRLPLGSASAISGPLALGYSALWSLDGAEVTLSEREPLAWLFRLCTVVGSASSAVKKLRHAKKDMHQSTVGGYSPRLNLNTVLAGLTGGDRW